MATTGLGKVLLVYISICVLLYIGGIRLIGDDNSNVLGKFIDVNKTDEGTVTYSSEINSSLPRSLTKTGVGLLDFIDSLGAIASFVIFIINIVFTPLGLFVSAGMPVGITLMIGLPLFISLVLAIAYFIRSGS